jgi:phthiocerol/phenolphthiocerol synthesis type-I polyketide synthase E
LFSSNASILGGLGSICYTAANIFMDAFAAQLGGTTGIRWISANWDGWLPNKSKRLSRSFQTSLDQYAMTQDQSLEALEYILSSQIERQVIVSTGDLGKRLAVWSGPGVGKSASVNGGAASAPNLHTRPSLTTAYVAASNEIEQVIVKVWQEVLGIDRLGIHDNFFDLGGNSLIGLKVISQLKKELDLDIPVIALFQGPTVCALAKVIGKERAEEPANEESRTRGERRRERVRFKRSPSDEIKAGSIV